MYEGIQGKSILVLVSESSSYLESTVYFIGNEVAPYCCGYSSWLRAKGTLHGIV